MGVGPPADTRDFGYGPLTQDQTQSLAVNSIYDFPDAVTKMVWIGWQLSGLTSLSSGAPVNVTNSVSGGSSAG